MEYEEIKQMLEELGIPVAYWRFDEDEPPPAPYVVFSMPESSNFIADGKVYKKFNKLYVELYVGEKSPRLEKEIEDLFDQYELAYTRQEFYLQDEKMFEELYEMEV